MTSINVRSNNCIQKHFQILPIIENAYNSIQIIERVCLGLCTMKGKENPLPLRSSLVREIKKVMARELNEKIITIMMFGLKSES